MLNTVDVSLFSHYYDINKTRIVNSFDSPSSYRVSYAKEENINCRLQYEYRYNDQICNGQTFYYTLTYNDKACPSFRGRNCHDYRDLRKFIHDGLEKYLKRKGFLLRYFVACELGEGGSTHTKKSKRGYANNPHYHCIFFVRPLVNTRHNIKYHISPQSFCEYVRMYWQGKDYLHVTDIKKCRDCRFGFAMPGYNRGVVDSVRALSYCSKYVTKSIEQRKFEDSLYSSFIDEFYKSLDLGSQLNIDLLHEFFHGFGLDFDLCKLNQYFVRRNKSYNVVDYIFKRLGCEFSSDWDLFLSHKAFEYARIKRNEYKNLFSTKCRYSQGLGLDLATVDILNDVNDPHIYCSTALNPRKEKSLGIYFMRKFYYCKVKESNGVKFDYPVYVLNARGRKMRCHQLELKKENTINRISSKINFVKSFPQNIDNLISFYDDRCLSGCYTKSDFIHLINRCDRDFLEKYYYYNKVYKGRFFDVSEFKPLDPVKDLDFFLRSAVFYADYHMNSLNVQKEIDNFIQFGKNFNYKLYSEHENFNKLVLDFSILDCMLDYFGYIEDCERRADRKFYDSIRKKQTLIKLQL